ncbi:MAG: ubiquinol-cytochrome C chaperone family protein [Phenylobacterium sp.]|uniref:ubiquinol-cytochrome C chaperone family protein n=1 Tax=Phenylobacterium sp. TaxID=1871053 RepID=UPI002A279077|nr:ubiquinol-cytochrome C chaperone family protein [Phenylobacterium sp.]MDD3836786.1 ubiquinol-cytochrome C chaperone family protein [Phenylobacterium sp.]MDX9999063.1 ubiquinol-cytochrome C chaperone family protein [Phenylobacterium sp.]
MILDRLFRPRAAQEAGRALYAAAVAEARQPRLYAELGAPDTPEGRFELYTLHVLLLIERLRGQGPAAAETSQALFDTYISALDHGLRELGVGDTSVGKKMRRLGEAFYGRGKSYDAAIAALPDRTPLVAFLGRTTFADATAGRPEALAEELLAKRDALAAQDLAGLLSGTVSWEARA